MSASDAGRERESSTVHLTRIYTKTGDDGTTALGDMSRTAKTDPRVTAYGDVDEANSVRVHSSNVRGFAHLPMTMEVR